MAPFTLYVGSKNYSSWSLRPWLAMKMAQVPFEEVLILLDQPSTRDEILRHSAAGRVPVLKHGAITVWDSMAICEYIAELFPEVRLWPREARARAVARSVCMEMHSGFAAMRAELSMNIWAEGAATAVMKRSPEAEADVARVLSIWRDCRARFGDAGPFLFGEFTIADAVYAPVVTRFRTYGAPHGATTRAYADAVWDLPPMREWIAAAKTEPKAAKYEALLPPVV